MDGALIFDIAKALDRTPMAILLRARALSGLESPDANKEMSVDYYDQLKTLKDVASNFGEKWSDADIETLMKMFRQGSNIAQIATYMRRSPNGVLLQIEKVISEKGEMTTFFNDAKRFFRLKRI